MRLIKSFAMIIFFGIAVMGLTITTAKAALIELDLATVGDGLITLDDVSNLEWLDVTETQGFSYFQTLFSIFVIDLSFRYATVTEVATLYNNAGVFDHDGGTADADRFPGVFTIISRLGCTLSCGTDTPGHFGIYDFVGFAPNDKGVASLTLQIAAGLGRAFLVAGIIVPDVSFGLIGSYLVRQAQPSVIPLPAALPLYGTGLAVMGFLGWRRKRQALRD